MQQPSTNNPVPSTLTALPAVLASLLTLRCISCQNSSPSRSLASERAAEGRLRRCERYNPRVVGACNPMLLRSKEDRSRPHREREYKASSPSRDRKESKLEG